MCPIPYPGIHIKLVHPDLHFSFSQVLKMRVKKNRRMRVTGANRKTKVTRRLEGMTWMCVRLDVIRPCMTTHAHSGKKGELVQQGLFKVHSLLEPVHTERL